MGKARLLYMVIIYGAISAIGLSCNHSPSEVPFPFGEREHPQPLNQVLKFSKESKIYWTDSVANVRPSIKKFDISKLPVKVFDSSGFLPFLKKPEEVSFDWNKLRDTIFNYDALPSRPLKYDVSVLDPPQLLNATHPHVTNGASDILFEFGEPFVGNSNECVLEDKGGFIWIASGNRLYRYDGEHLLLYSLGSFNAILNMVEDNDGKIWLGAESLHGLAILDFKSGTQSHIEILEEPRGYNVDGMMLDEKQRVWVTTDDRNPKDGNPIYIIDKNRQNIKQLSKTQGVANGNALFQDEIGNIFISTFGEGLNIINLKEGKIKYLQRNDGLSSDTLGAIQKDNMNKVVAASFIGGELNIIDMQHGIIRIYDKRQGIILKDNIHIGNILEDNSGNIWMGTWGRGEDVGAGVEIIDHERSLFKNISTSNGLSGNKIGGLLQDKHGQIWVSTNKGLNIIRRNGDNPKHTGYDNITTLAEDSRGNIWVGIINSGIKILDTTTGLARSFNESNGLSSNNIQNMDSYHGSMYIESYRGLDIIDSGFTAVKHIGKAEGLMNDSIGQALHDKEGRTWITGGRTIGLNVMNQGKIFHLGIAQGLKDSTLETISQDPEGRIWFSNFAKGIGVIDLKVNTVKYLDNIAQLNMQGDKILVPDKRGNMWIGTENGIYIINAAQDSIMSISEREGLVGNSVISLNEYANSMYVGTSDGGINILTPPDFSLNKKWQIEFFGKTQGIYKKVAGMNQSDIITRDGRFLWGDKGITILRKTGLELVIPQTYISEIDLLNKPLSFRDESWPGINTDTIWSSKRDTFYLRNNSSGNESYPDHQNIRWDSVSGPYHMPVNLEFPYDENYLQFHFTQENVGDQDTAWYSYILNGVDKKWSDKTDKSFSQNYLNLLPGNYIFRVSSLSNGKWCEPVNFNFTIHPPWWKTWWAYLSYVFICCVMIWSIIKYRSRRLIEDNRRLEKIVAQRTNELKLSLENLQSAQRQLIQSEKMASLGELTAGIAHEIQNPLNFMNNFSDVNAELIEELKEELKAGNNEGAMTIAADIADNEHKINHHGRRADAIVKGMLQHSRISKGQKEPTDVNALADEYLRLSYHGLRAKEKSFNSAMQTDFDPAVGKMDIMPQDIGRVLLNLYNNAFYAVYEKSKQHPEGYEPAVFLKTKRNGDIVEIRVKDNGNGIAQKIIDKIFQPFFTTKPTGEGTGLGLSLSYDIIKAHGGELKVDSREGEGAEFIVQLPLG